MIGFSLSIAANIKAHITKAILDSLRACLDLVVRQFSASRMWVAFAPVEAIFAEQAKHPVLLAVDPGE